MRTLLGIFFWGGALVVLVILGWLVILAIRRRVTNPPMETMGFGFSLKQIDAMYERGEITEDEFKALKARKAQQSARIAEKFLATPGHKPPTAPKE